MDVYDALRKAEVGQKIKPVGYDNNTECFIIKKKLKYDGTHVGDHFIDTALKSNWEIMADKIKVTIDGKEGFISKESAKELKKMLG